MAMVPEGADEQYQFYVNHGGFYIRTNENIPSPNERVNALHPSSLLPRLLAKAVLNFQVVYTPCPLPSASIKSGVILDDYRFPYITAAVCRGMDPHSAAWVGINYSNPAQVVKDFQSKFSLLGVDYDRLATLRYYNFRSNSFISVNEAQQFQLQERDKEFELEFGKSFVKLITGAGFNLLTEYDLWPEYQNQQYVWNGTSGVPKAAIYFPEGF